MRAQELVDSLKEQALQFIPTVALEERVLQVEKQANKIELITDKGTHFAKSIIVTAGVVLNQGDWTIQKRTNMKKKTFIIMLVT